MATVQEFFATAIEMPLEYNLLAGFKSRNDIRPVSSMAEPVDPILFLAFPALQDLPWYGFIRSKRDEHDRAGLRPVRAEMLFDTEIRSWIEKSTKHFSNAIEYGLVLAGGKGCCFCATFAERKAT